MRVLVVQPLVVQPLVAMVAAAVLAASPSFVRTDEGNLSVLSGRLRRLLLLCVLVYLE